MFLAAFDSASPVAWVSGPGPASSLCPVGSASFTSNARANRSMISAAANETSTHSVAPTRLRRNARLPSGRRSEILQSAPSRSNVASKSKSRSTTANPAMVRSCVASARSLRHDSICASAETRTRTVPAAASVGINSSNQTVPLMSLLCPAKAASSFIGGVTSTPPARPSRRRLSDFPVSDFATSRRAPSSKTSGAESRAAVSARQRNRNGRQIPAVCWDGCVFMTSHLRSLVESARLLGADPKRSATNYGQLLAQSINAWSSANCGAHTFCSEARTQRDSQERVTLHEPGTTPASKPGQAITAAASWAQPVSAVALARQASSLARESAQPAKRATLPVQTYFASAHEKYASNCVEQPMAWLSFISRSPSATHCEIQSDEPASEQSPTASHTAPA